MQIVGDVAAELSDAKLFSVLDATSSFWHIKLEDSDPEIFQKRMNQAFDELRVVKTIADDIPIWGRNKAEHNHRLEQMLECSRKVGLKLEKELLAIVYGCTKFHQYVYDKKVKVQTDYKPLEALFKKSIIPSTTEIAANDDKITALCLASGVWTRQKLVHCRYSKSCSRSKQWNYSQYKKDEFKVLTLENLPVSEVKLEQFKDATRKYLTEAQDHND